jgi:hypothetical protein
MKYWKKKNERKKEHCKWELFCNREEIGIAWEMLAFELVDTTGYAVYGTLVFI